MFFPISNQLPNLKIIFDIPQFLVEKRCSARSVQIQVIEKG